MKRLWFSLLVVCSAVLVQSQGMAEGIRLEQTRVIFSGDTNNQTVTIVNDDDSPYLIQSGVTKSVDGGKSHYFVVTPPLFRIDANTKFSLRLFLKNKSELATDQESIFYLNTRAIPATNSMESTPNNAKLVFVTNIIIKLIYRPSDLSVPSDNSFKQVELERQGTKWQFTNPTPYYMTLVNIKINNKPYKRSILIAPFSQTKLEGVEKDISEGQWQMLNDYGGTTPIYSKNRQDVNN
ncbi:MULTISPECIES: fimbrial biogenesis chaperone [Providencia]|uniref:fimbrial biogenesis chaperone n=1 Tax=Providencia TaxID=586 RepID=UPI001C5B4C97|nr:molecular chaperone [Providencia rettgeri]ELR5149594.1 molecular chaperone [Providencia rettgeri]QXX83383.1 molecular chaperone [Providencia sp. R33]